MHHIGWLIGLVVVMAACRPTSPTDGASGGQPPPPAQQQRTIVAAIRVEPNTLAAKALGQQGGGVATYLSKRMFNADLTILDEQALPRPYLAEALPQLNTDTWHVFPDGRMETTYQLRPNLAWHDGTPLSSEDFVFAWRVYSSPELGASASLPFSLIEQVLAPDARTVQIRWKRPYPAAGALQSTGTGATGLPPLPRALLQSTLDGGSVDAMVNHPFWTREFVGLGPFKLVSWEPGAFIEGVAFDKHVLGRPRLDRIKLLFMPDSNAALASMLSGDVQMSADDGIPVGIIPALKNGWGAGQGTILLHANQWRAAYVQLKPEYTSPAALLDVRVRKALAFAVDKVPINDAVFDGQFPIADSMIPRNTEVGRAVDAAIAKYPFDSRRSEELMTQAGFTRGADGFYTGTGGARFTAEIKVNASRDYEAEMAALGDGWRRVGFDMREAVNPISLSQNNEARATYSGMFSFNTNAGENAAATLSTANMARAENRW
jgi:peptide/nickel transport system substrate-binding protein